MTTLRAYAREEEQRGQRAAARLNRVRSALTQSVNVVVRQKFTVHAVYPAEESGQLPFLGSSNFLVQCGLYMSIAGRVPSHGEALLRSRRQASKAGTSETTMLHNVSLSMPR